MAIGQDPETHRFGPFFPFANSFLFFCTPGFLSYSHKQTILNAVCWNVRVFLVRRVFDNSNEVASFAESVKNKTGKKHC